MKHIFLGTALALMSTSAFSASITTTLLSNTKVGDAQIVVDEFLGGSALVPLADNLAKSVTSTHVDRFGPGTGTATSSHIIDQTTGSFKFGTSASVTAPTSQITSRSNAEVSLYLVEHFTIEGTGDITFNLAIDGILNAGSPRGSAFWNGTMRLVDESGPFNFDVIGSDSTSLNIPSGTSSVIDDVLSFTTTISKSQDYLFTLSLGARSRVEAKGFGNSSASESNFLNTAFLSFDAADTLTVTASDPLFLSAVGSGPVSAVPLPTSALFVLSGLAVLCLRKRS